MACGGSEPTAPPAQASGPDIAFLSYRSGLTLWVTKAGDSTVTQVAAVRGYDLSYSWSPDGKRLAFAGGRDSASDGIYTVNADGTGLERLTTDPTWTWGVAWSPDGSKIAFVTYGGIHVMSAAGIGQVTVADSFLRTGPPDPISWSPDGKRIAYANVADGWPEIFAVNADGSARTRITHGHRGAGNCCGDANTGPSWSPDGNSIAYQHSDFDANKYEIHVIRVDGTGEVNLTANLPIALYPTWAPVGGLLAFWSLRGDAYELYVTNTTGSVPLPITVGADYNACRYISWSADGTRLAYCAQGDVYAVGVDGSRVVNLTNNPAFDGSPAWSPRP